MAQIFRDDNHVLTHLTKQKQKQKHMARENQVIKQCDKNTQLMRTLISHVFTQDTNCIPHRTQQHTRIEENNAHKKTRQDSTVRALSQDWLVVITALPLHQILNTMAIKQCVFDQLSWR